MATGKYNLGYKVATHPGMIWSGLLSAFLDPVADELYYRTYISSIYEFEFPDDVALAQYLAINPPLPVRVRVIASSNVGVLSGGLIAGTVIDGIEILEGDLVLLTAETDNANNGIWYPQGFSNFGMDGDVKQHFYRAVRASDVAGSYVDYAYGLECAVFEGTAYHESSWTAWWGDEGNRDGGAIGTKNINVRHTAARSAFSPHRRVTTPNYTLTIEDANVRAIIEYDYPTPTNLIVPANAFDTNTQFTIVQLGDGNITLTPASGVKINSVKGLTTSGKFAVISLYESDFNVWVASGDLYASLFLGTGSFVAAAGGAGVASAVGASINTMGAFAASGTGLASGAGAFSAVRSAALAASGRASMFAVAVVDDPYAKLLLHGDVRPGNAIVDYSPAGHGAASVFGNAKPDASVSAFLVNSISFVTYGMIKLGPMGDYISFPDSDDWDFGSGDFTIDFIARWTAVPTVSQIFVWQMSPSGYPNWQLGYNVEAGFIYAKWTGTSGDTLYYKTASPTGLTRIIVSPPIGIVANTNHHFAFVRNGPDFYIFKDGVPFVLFALTPAETKTLENVASPLFIGNRDNVSFKSPDWMTEIRISKGIARWIDNFTPPTSQYMPVLITL